MKVIKQTPTQLTIQTCRFWDGLLLISPFIVIGLGQIVFVSNWIGGGIFLLFSLCLLDGAIDEIYIFDKSCDKMTVKRRGLWLNRVTQGSTRNICAVELNAIADSEGNFSYYVDLLMLGGDRVCLGSNAIAKEQQKTVDLICEYLNLAPHKSAMGIKNEKIVLF
ncbi:hypothetical protein [Tychonema sp. LEGE 06208]|uniref:hypothetical protein n=1 Tax=Tychonema sp. LEGE 06208 TaxID=1828663 RepID=UPI00187F80F7|nr:hypothetical protein [Tychonema sp. LEGE 06208]MBE9164374.1 hypothetical protein [Tychonema sp. LEGE 06208]